MDRKEWSLSVERFLCLVVYFLIHVAWVFVNGQMKGDGLHLIKNNLPIGPFMQLVDKYVR